MSRVDRIEQAAGRWLVRRAEPDWTAADQAELEAWLAQSAAHKVAFWRLKDSWEKGDRLASRRAPEPFARPSPPPKRKRLYLVAGLAAAVALVLAVPTFLMTPGTRFETARGVQQTVRLTDGSRVELNTATRLRADLAQTRREVWLDAGEAFFDVEHDPSRPFVVHAGPRTVTVLGTKFSVRRDGDQVRVVVLEGRVRLDDGRSARRKREDLLTAGAIAQTAAAGVLVRQAGLERVEDDLGWRDGLLIFDQVTLAEAVAEFNRYNTRQLVIADPSVSTIRIGGRLQAHNADGFTRLLERTYGLKVEERGGRVMISQ